MFYSLSRFLISTFDCQQNRAPLPGCEKRYSALKLHVIKARARTHDMSSVQNVLLKQMEVIPACTTLLRKRLHNLSGVLARKHFSYASLRLNDFIGFEVLLLALQVRGIFQSALCIYAVIICFYTVNLELAGSL